LLRDLDFDLDLDRDDERRLLDRLLLESLDLLLDDERELLLELSDELTVRPPRKFSTDALH
jgi:hypothetical protein